MRRQMYIGALWLSLLSVVRPALFAQSIEVMAGTERMFIDAQWLKAFDDGYRWTLFSRSRATADYEDNTSLFSGVYLNYTVKSGFGLTLLGKIADNGGGGDAGVHYFNKSDDFMLYALASVDGGDERSYNWFSIMRYTPPLAAEWKLFAGLELFTAFVDTGHAASVQRARLGLEYQDFQFGLALNTAGYGANYTNVDVNSGLFVRREF